MGVGRCHVWCHPHLLLRVLRRGWQRVAFGRSRFDNCGRIAPALGDWAPFLDLGSFKKASFGSDVRTWIVRHGGEQRATVVGRHLSATTLHLGSTGFLGKLS